MKRIKISGMKERKSPTPEGRNLEKEYPTGEGYQFKGRFGVQGAKWADIKWQYKTIEQS